MQKYPILMESIWILLNSFELTPTCRAVYLLISNYFLGQSDIWRTLWWCPHQPLEASEVGPLLQCTEEGEGVAGFFLIFIVCTSYFVKQIIGTW